MSGKEGKGSGCKGQREEECWEESTTRNMMASYEEVGLLLVGP